MRHRYYRALLPAARGYFKDDISAVIETQYKRLSPLLILTTAASLVALLNSVVLGPGLNALASALALRFQSRELNTPAQ
jgi:hypothetical protein